jgi:hypothetical protein
LGVSTEAETQFALLSDVTPNRATVEFVGTEEEARDANIYCDAYVNCVCVPVRDGITVQVGERVWVERAGDRVSRVSGNA